MAPLEREPVYSTVHPANVEPFFKSYPRSDMVHLTHWCVPKAQHGNHGRVHIFFYPPRCPTLQTRRKMYVTIRSLYDYACSCVYGNHILALQTMAHALHCSVVAIVKWL
jgi:hypothetical protein